MPFAKNGSRLPLRDQTDQRGKNRHRHASSNRIVLEHRQCRRYGQADDAGTYYPDLAAPAQFLQLHSCSAADPDFADEAEQGGLFDGSFAQAQGESPNSAGEAFPMSGKTASAGRFLACWRIASLAEEYALAASRISGLASRSPSTRFGSVSMTRRISSAVGLEISAIFGRRSHTSMAVWVRGINRSLIGLRAISSRRGSSSGPASSRKDAIWRTTSPESPPVSGNSAWGGSVWVWSWSAYLPARYSASALSTCGSGSRSPEGRAGSLRICSSISAAVGPDRSAISGRSFQIFKAAETSRTRRWRRSRSRLGLSGKAFRTALTRRSRRSQSLASRSATIARARFNSRRSNSRRDSPSVSEAISCSQRSCSALAASIDDFNDSTRRMAR